MKLFLFLVIGLFLIGGTILLSCEKQAEPISLCDYQPTFGIPMTFESIPQAQFYLEQRAIILEGCD